MREYPEAPRVGVGIVLLRGDEVLLVKRAKPPGEGQWSLPGGAQELGETAEETARRELFEETGLHAGQCILSPTRIPSITTKPAGCNTITPSWISAPNMRMAKRSPAMM